MDSPFKIDNLGFPSRLLAPKFRKTITTNYFTIKNEHRNIKVTFLYKSS